jgi:UDP:flavonoid glycosyltransferase YjiC (YdhE family)
MWSSILNWATPGVEKYYPPPTISTTIMAQTIFSVDAMLVDTQTHESGLEYAIQHIAYGDEMITFRYLAIGGDQYHAESGLSQREIDDHEGFDPQFNGMDRWVQYQDELDIFFQDAPTFFPQRVDYWRTSLVAQRLRAQYPRLAEKFLFMKFCDLIETKAVTGTVQFSVDFTYRPRNVTQQEIHEWAMAHLNLYVLQHPPIMVERIRIPFYPRESSRLDDSMEELSMMLNEMGQAMVYRHSMRHTMYGGYVYIRPVHLWSGGALICQCQGVTCECCIEIRDRAINAYNGVYDFLPSQRTGHFDTMDPQVADPYAWVVAHNELIPQENEQMPELVVAVQTPALAPTVDARGVHVEHSEEPRYCAICLEDLHSSLTVGCGHSYHAACLYRWGPTCPMCRAAVDFNKAEVYEPLFVEYACTDESDSNVEFDDPIEYSQLVPRQGRFHIYIAKTNFKKDARVYIEGPIIQVLDISQPTEVELSRACLNFTAEGETEYQYIASKPLKFTVVQDPPQKEYKPKIMFVIVGTYGDIAPMQALSAAYNNMGGESTVLAPIGDTEFAKQWKAMDEHFRKTCAEGYLHWDSASEIVNIGKLKDTMLAAVEQYRPDVIVSSFFVPCVQYIASLMRLQLVWYGSIPQGEGALIFSRQNTRWGKFWAQQSEKLQLSLTSLAPVMHFLNDSFARYVPPKGSVMAIAPELYEGGVGTLRMPMPDTSIDQYDIFHCMGSTNVTQEEEQQWFQQYSMLKSKSILFQTQNIAQVHPMNVTLIGAHNHNDSMKNSKLVVCHGGSGTLQTALANGCAVLVEPTWIDQKYWITQSRKKGFLVEELNKDEFLIQVCAMLCNPRIWTQKLTSLSPETMMLHILDKVEEPKEQLGTFVWSSDSNWPVIGKLTRLVLGRSLVDHVGVGTFDGHQYTFVDAIDDGGWFTRVKVSEHIPKYVTQVEFVPFKFDVELFTTVVEKRDATDNCRSMTEKYMNMCGGDIHQAYQQMAGKSNMHNVGTTHLYEYVSARATPVAMKKPSTSDWYNLRWSFFHVDGDFSHESVSRSVYKQNMRLEVHNSVEQRTYIYNRRNTRYCVRMVTADWNGFQRESYSDLKMKRPTEGLPVVNRHRMTLACWWNYIVDYLQLTDPWDMAGGAADLVVWFKDQNKVLKMTVDMPNVNIERRFEMEIEGIRYYILLMPYLPDDGTSVSGLDTEDIIDLHRGNVRVYNGVIKYIDVNTDNVVVAQRYYTSWVRQAFKDVAPMSLVFHETDVVQDQDPNRLKLGVVKFGESTYICVKYSPRIYPFKEKEFEMDDFDWGAEIAAQVIVNTL